MTDYRRVWRAGATWFFTVNLADRSSSLLVDRIELLRDAFRYTLRRHPFRMDALCILPDHLHAVLTLPAQQSDFALRWRLIKTEFSRRMPAREARSPSRIRKGERAIWQRRYWEHLVRDEDDLRRHLEYTHFNPVKHRHVERVADWPHSTFHRHVREGTYPIDWHGSEDIARMSMG